MRRCCLTGRWREGTLLSSSIPMRIISIYDSFNYKFPPAKKQLIPSGVVPDWRSEFRKHVSGDEIVVPVGKYFAMGDNRDHSSDSRYWGFVDRDAIMGRPFLIYWSVDATSSDYAQTTFWQ